MGGEEDEAWEETERSLLGRQTESTDPTQTKGRSTDGLT